MDGNAYVLPSFLKSYGLTQKIITNRLKQFKDKKSSFYDHFHDFSNKKHVWIKYNSLHLKDFKKYELPSEYELLFSIREEKEDENFRLIKTSFQFAVDQGFKSYIKEFVGIFDCVNTITKYAKEYALFNSVKNLLKYDINIKTMYEVYDQYNFSQIKINSEKTFYRKLNDFRKEGAKSLVHRSLGVGREKGKFPEQVYNQLTKIYRNPKHYSGRVIHQMLTSWCLENHYKPVSFSTVKSFIAKADFQNMNNPYRYGKEWAERNFNPYKLRNVPDYNGTLWQLDGTRIQIPFFNKKKKKEDFLYIFVVMDVHSRKIIGHALDYTENKSLIIESLKNAVKNTGYLPREILRDNGSSFSSKEYKFLEEQIKFLGTYCRSHAVGMPRDKAQVERFFGTFQTTVLKYIDGYMGEGITSSKERERPNNETLKESRKITNLRTKEKLTDIINESIHNYNHVRIHEDRPSPEGYFLSANLDSAAHKISDHEFALMFWDRDIVKVKNSMIILTSGNRSQYKHPYEIQDLNLRYKINLTEVIVCYKKSDRSIIKIYDQNEKWLSDLKLSKHTDMVFKKKKHVNRENIEEQVDSNEKNRSALDKWNRNTHRWISK